MISFSLLKGTPLPHREQPVNGLQYIQYNRKIPILRLLLISKDNDFSKQQLVGSAPFRIKEYSLSLNYSFLLLQ